MHSGEQALDALVGPGAVQLGVAGAAKLQRVDAETDHLPAIGSHAGENRDLIEGGGGAGFVLPWLAERSHFFVEVDTEDGLDGLIEEPRDTHGESQAGIGFGEFEGVHGLA